MLTIFKLHVDASLYMYIFSCFSHPLHAWIGPKMVKRSSLPSMSGKPSLPHNAVNSTLTASETRDSTNLSVGLEDCSDSANEEELTTTMGNVESIADSLINNFQQTFEDTQGAL